MSGYMGGPMAGQQVTPESLQQAEQGGMLDMQALAQGMPAQAGAPAEEPPAEGGGDQEEAALIKSIIADMLRLAGGNTLSEQNKANVQQAMSLFQKIKAGEEREAEQAMTGKVSPRLLQKAYSGSPGG